MDRFVTCPECRKELLLPEKMLHKYVKCPECQAAFCAQEKRNAAVAPPRSGEPDTSWRPNPRHEDKDREVQWRRTGLRQPGTRRPPWYFLVMVLLVVIALVSGSQVMWVLAMCLAVAGLLIDLGLKLAGR
jgi:hypothetical protein